MLLAHGKLLNKLNKADDYKSETPEEDGIIFYKN
jgi:hypothetical protein